MTTFLRKLFPFLEWFEYCSARPLRMDIIAGLTVAMVLIPQSMAYAQLAGLPSFYGLYTAFPPPLAAALEPLASTGSQGYIGYAIMLSCMVGLFQFALGVLGLGMRVNLLSLPVVNASTNAATPIIASSQLSKLFGVHVDKATHQYETIIRVVHAAAIHIHWLTLYMGILAFVMMYILKRLWPVVPNVLGSRHFKRFSAASINRVTWERSMDVSNYDF